MHILFKVNKMKVKLLGIFNTSLLQVAVEVVTAASTTERGNVTRASVMLATRWVPTTRVKVSARRQGMHAYISVHVYLHARLITVGCS